MFRYGYGRELHKLSLGAHTLHFEVHLVDTSFFQNRHSLLLTATNMWQLAIMSAYFGQMWYQLNELRNVRYGHLKKAYAILFHINI